jgi:hypothetical protein
MRARRSPESAESTPESTSRVTSPDSADFVSNQSVIDTMKSEQVVGVESQLTVEVGGTGLDPGEPTGNLFLSFLSEAPEGAAIADLDAGDLIEADTEYVKLTAGSVRYLNIGVLGVADRTQLEQWFTDAHGEFHLNDQGRLVLGLPAGHLNLSANTEGAQAVLDGANGRSVASDMDTEQRLVANTWRYLNDGESVLNKEDATPDSDWRRNQVKPGAWYNGYEIENGQVQTVEHPFDTSGTAAPTLGLDGLKEVIMLSMNVAKVAESLGNNYDMFAEGLTKRFGAESTLVGSAFDSMCEELWSYLKTGAGTDGNVDIGRLQAVVRAISPDTKATADSNTEFTGPSFEVGDLGQELNRGDGVFGRATMMSLMHLFGEFTTTATKPPSVGLVQADLFGEHDTFISDDSWSMTGGPTTQGKWDRVQSAVDGSMGWGPSNGIQSRSVGTFDNNDVELEGESKTDMREVLAEAFAIIYPDNTRDDRTDFAGLFSVDRSEIFDGDVLDARRLMYLLGEEGSRDFGSKGESSLKAALFVLTNLGAIPADNPLRAGTANGERVRLNTVADEPEQALEYLPLVKALADKLGIDVRLVSVPTRGADYEENPVGKIVFVDIDDIHVHDDNTVSVTFSQGGVERTTTVPLEDANNVGDADRYEDAALNIGGLQHVQGERR